MSADHRQLCEVSSILLLGVESVLPRDIRPSRHVDLDGPPENLDAVANQRTVGRLRSREVHESRSVELARRLVRHPMDAGNLAKLIEALTCRQTHARLNAQDGRQWAGRSMRFAGAAPQLRRRVRMCERVSTS